MADNYLERKMEEHRRATPQRKSSAVPTKGKLSFNFPPRRVVLFDLDDNIVAQLAKAYGETGCRVAIYPETSVITDGARLISSTNNPEFDFVSVLKAWGDIDIVVSSTESTILDKALQSILTNRESLPYPNDYGLRLILINKSTSPTTDIFTKYSPCVIDTKEPISPDMISKIVRSALFLSINEMTTTNIQL